MNQPGQELHGLLAAALAWALLSFSYLAVAVIAAWAATEVLAR